MNKRPTILLFEEDSFAAELISDMLQEHFQLIRTQSATETIRMLGKNNPELFLLNMGEPGNSGFDISKAIRDNPKTNDVPIIFLSESSHTEQLFQLYEAGGDDYLNRSLDAQVFLSRIHHTLAQREERNKLKAEVSNAFSVAMSAMSSASDIGQILQFLSASFKCQDYLSLCKEVLNTMAFFGLDARVQVRGEQPTVSYSNLGFCSVLEESVFSTMLDQGRLVNFSTHTACNYEHVSLIVKNMPKDDAERYGRFSDNLALLCEAVNERIISLDNEIALIKQKESFARLVDIVNGALVEINQKLIDSIKLALIEICELNQAQNSKIFRIPELSSEQEAALRAILMQDSLAAKLKNLLQQVSYHTTNLSSEYTSSPD